MTDITSSPGTDLNEPQQRKLVALLETILPGSENGRMPSAAELDFTGYLSTDAPEFARILPGILDQLDAGFADLPLSERVAAVEVFADSDPKTFDDLLFRIYACYYQDDHVRRLIGSEPGPPFPRGNTIPAGDLSSLDRVVERSGGYRRVPTG